MLDNMRSLSCRGVAFESKSPSPTVGALPLQEEMGPTDNNGGGRWVWLPWGQGNSFKIHPFGANQIQRSMSRPSSHFCDMADEDEEQEEDIIELSMSANLDIENQKPTLLPTLEKKASSLGKPAKKDPNRLSVILLDQGLFTVYKRLFAVSFAINITMLVLATAGKFPYAKERPALFCMGNILALTLCRSEAFLRVFFWLAVKVLGKSYVPIFVKTATTSFLQSVGGIHSSCGLSSVAWLIYALILTLNDRVNNPSELIAVASTILSLLCFSCLAAFPLVRHLHHNVFERTHRFAGWTALAFLWAFVFLKFGYDSNTKSYSNFKESNLVKTQELWFTVAITFFTILPWITVRRVPVSVSAPSGHASIIKFAGGVQSGILGRISRSPLSEWHAFGIISDNKDSHMMLAGAVGDFTRGLVTNPPKHLWVREVHFAGLPYLVNMYGRAVLVATGSGICVFLSFLLQKGSADVCIVWVTKGVEQNFGTEIKEMMNGFPKEQVIVHDTAVLGRPNVALLAINAAKNWKAEVVVVTSNPQGSRDVVEACKAVGYLHLDPFGTPKSSELLILQ